MPCRSDYMERSWGEKELSKAAKNLIYVKKSLGLKVLSEERDLAEDYYPDEEKADYVVSTLCSLITKMTPKQLDSIVYNARNKDARKVADWWDAHQEADKKRIAKEKAKRRKEKLKSGALEKLTDSEREVLGHPKREPRRKK